MYLLTAWIAGLLFGFGLILSGMTNPAKVQAFLDLGGNWDPSLVFVMAGAIFVGFFAFRMAAKRKASLLGAAMSLPATRLIDRRLVLGSLSFGVGWGLAGFCPGPALASLLVGQNKPAIFVAAMLAGMAIFEMLERIPRITKRHAA